MKVIDPIRKVFEFSVKDRDGDIRAFIAMAGEDKFDWSATMCGFDDDPRELTEIPEARKLAQRLINLGMLSIMIQPRPDGSSDRPTFALDAIHLHICAHGIGSVRRYKGKTWTRHQVLMVPYFHDLRRSMVAVGATMNCLETIDKIITRLEEAPIDPLDGSADFVKDVEDDLQQWSQRSMAGWN